VKRCVAAKGQLENRRGLPWLCGTVLVTGDDSELPNGKHLPRLRRTRIRPPHQMEGRLAPWSGIREPAIAEDLRPGAGRA